MSDEGELKKRILALDKIPNDLSKESKDFLAQLQKIETNRVFEILDEAEREFPTLIDVLPLTEEEKEANVEFVVLAEMRLVWKKKWFGSAEPSLKEK